MTAAGFHEGERAVQRRAGTEHDAGRLSGMLDPPWLDGGFSRFLAARVIHRVMRAWTARVINSPPLDAAYGCDSG